MCFALSGMIFCLDFDLFFFSSLVPLPHVFSFFLYLINFEKTNKKMKCTNWSKSQLYYGMVKSVPLKLGKTPCNPIRISQLGNIPNKMNKVMTIP